MTLRDRIAHELTQLDARHFRDPSWNRYFIGLALQSLEGFERDAEQFGPARAYADRFTPTRETAVIARRLNLGLTVERGRWILPNGDTI